MSLLQLTFILFKSNCANVVTYIYVRVTEKVTLKVISHIVKISPVVGHVNLGSASRVSSSNFMSDYRMLHEILAPQKKEKILHAFFTSFSIVQCDMLKIKVSDWLRYIHR